MSANQLLFLKKPVPAIHEIKLVLTLNKPIYFQFTVL